MKNVLATYINGNYHVTLLNDGTKIRYNKLNNLVPSFAESIDCNITEKCDGGCAYCYLGCNENGKHADLNQPFFNTLHKGQELALNGNDLTHPQLKEFLIRMKNQGVICNLTVNQIHFIRCIDKIRELTNERLIHGLGISLVNSADSRLYDYLKEFSNAVLHTIDGLLTLEDLARLSNRNIKLLILGYKVLGRGDEYYNKHYNEINNNIDWLKHNIAHLKKAFKVISFDNLAIEHLDLKNQIAHNIWEHSYMGDEGEFTFYIDAVNKKFAISSLSSVQYDLKDNVDEMFEYIRNHRNEINNEKCAEWIEVYDHSRLAPIRRLSCSICKQEWLTEVASKFKYCPNCGAKIDEKCKESK